MQLDKYVIPLKTIYFYYISKVFENNMKKTIFYDSLEYRQSLNLIGKYCMTM